MVRKLLLLILFAFAGGLVIAQTSVGGKVIDDNGEGVILANVAVYKNGSLITGTQTDFDGNYTVSPIDPGTYDVEFSYTGAQTTKVNGVVVYAGKANKLDATLTSGVNLETVVVVDYKVPLIEQDNTTQGATITSDQIKNLPTRNINALATTSAGISAADEGGDISVRGSRTDGTDYYIDGMRVSGSAALIPESEIDQLQVITGGIEAQYGDVTGGIISITTKGPSAKWSGGVEFETSELFDPYDNRIAGFNVSGPLLKKKETGESIIGIRLAGRYTYQLDDDPSAIDLYRVTDASLTELEANPVIQRTNSNGTVSNFVAADFTTLDDVAAIQARPFEENTRYDLTAKLDARLSKAVDITLSGSYRNQDNQFTPDTDDSNRDDEWAVFNAHNNPISHRETLRGNFRFRHRLGGADTDDTGKASAIQNASYTLQFSYENNINDLTDSRHGNNYFNYGHVGDFDIEWVPTFNFDPFSGELLHTDYLEVLRGYQPGGANPVLANYNNVLSVPTGEALNGNIGNSVVFINGISTAGGSLGFDDFIGRNGTISDQFDNSWSFHTNVGWVYNLARQEDNDIYTANINSSFDLVPGGDSNKGRHNIQFGVLYEQRANRRYDVSPRRLWDVARQQANAHIQGIPENPDTIGFMEVFNPVFGAIDTAAIYALDISESSDNLFYRRVRESLGINDLSQYVNTDGLDPNQLSLDMFSAKELNDEEILDYYGYDYLGNEFDGTFDEFFTATDANGVRTFPVAPARPIYFAGYIQDKFTFKDIIFRLGLRVDRYDANTKVLKDNYSLYDIQGASDFHAINPDLERPGNIDDDFKVYTNEGGTAVQGYRNGDDWFFPNGAPANNATELFPGGLVNPAYTDDRVNSVSNFIKSRDFDPNVSFEDYEPQINWMPRLAFSFPISDDANFFAHYDILVQRPPSNTIATAYDYFYFTDLTNTVKSNPNLRPERTVDYEVGFQQRLSASSSLKLSAYYKEMRDMIQRRTFFPVPIVNQYTTFDNLDFGTVKGFSFAYDLRRTGNVTLQANYTLQFADGTGSDANSQRGLTSRGNIRNLLPLNFDERHRLVATLDYRYGSGKKYNGPRVGGKDILSKFGVNVQTIAVSGRPYTARIQPTVLGGSGFKGAINGARKPWNYTVNLRVDKSFSLGKGLNFNAYVRVSNLLDRRNTIDVYSATGSPSDDGYLASPDGLNNQNTVESSTRELQSYLASYQWSILNPDFFSLPRRMFAGIIFDF